jgi:uncharacterized protein
MNTHPQAESVISIELLAKIKSQYRLEWFGIHGVKHWSRTYNNGMKLAGQTGVNRRVVQLFSIFHDACRWTEGRDIDHGSRGALLAKELRKYCPVNDAEFDLLTTACELHTDTLDHKDITTQACFDSDRWDLGRDGVGHYPDPERLCTPRAKQKEAINQAYKNSIHQNDLPENSFGLAGYGEV